MACPSGSLTDSSDRLGWLCVWGADGPTRCLQLANLVPCGTQGLTVTHRGLFAALLKVPRVDEQVTREAVLFHQREHICGDAAHGVVHINHQRPGRQGAGAGEPGVQLVIVDGGELKLASDSQVLLEPLQCQPVSDSVTHRDWDSHALLGRFLRCTATCEDRRSGGRQTDPCQPGCDEFAPAPHRLLSHETLLDST